MVLTPEVEEYCSRPQSDCVGLRRENKPIWRTQSTAVEHCSSLAFLAAFLGVFTIVTTHVHVREIQHATRVCHVGHRCKGATEAYGWQEPWRESVFYLEDRALGATERVKDVQQRVDCERSGLDDTKGELEFGEYGGSHAFPSVSHMTCCVVSRVAATGNGTHHSLQTVKSKRGTSFMQTKFTKVHPEKSNNKIGITVLHM